MPSSRQTLRLPPEAIVGVRRSMGPYLPVRLIDLSAQGCSVELVDRVNLHDILWVRFPGLEARQGAVSWKHEYSCGIEFLAPLHPAVLDLLITRLGNP